MGQDHDQFDNDSHGTTDDQSIGKPFASLGRDQSKRKTNGKKTRNKRVKFDEGEVEHIEIPIATSDSNSQAADDDTTTLLFINCTSMARHIHSLINTDAHIVAIAEHSTPANNIKSREN